MIVTKGSINQSVTIRIVDSTDGTPETGVVWNTAGIDMQYRREGAASTAIIEATLAALTTAHTDGGFLHIGNGYYRLDVPDAAFASGVDGVLIHGTVTGMVVIGVYVQLADVDIFDSVRGGMTVLPASGTLAVNPVLASGTHTGAVIPTVTTTTTATNLTNLPTIPANWITAAGIAASAMNGKGDWNVGKTGYSLTQTFPANFADMAITLTTGQVTVGTNSDKTGYTVSTVSDKTGYSLSASQTFNITGSLSGSVGSVTGAVGSVTGAVGSVTGNVGGSVASLGAQAKLDVNAEVDTAIADANLDHLVGTATGIPAIPAGTYLDQIMDDGTAVFDRTTDSLQAIRDRGDAAWVTGAGGSDRLLMVDTTIATLASQTSFTLTAGSADNKAYNNCTIIVEDVATSTQKSVGMVLGYTGATKTVTLKEAMDFTIAATDKVYILAENSLKSTVKNRQLDVSAAGAVVNVDLVDVCTTNTDMVVAPDNAGISGIQADLDNATDGLGALKILIDAVNTDLSNPTDGLGALKTLIDTVNTDLSNGTDGLGALKALIDTVNTDLSNGTDGLGALKALIDGLNNITTAQVNAEVADVLNVDVLAELSAVPAANAPISEKINWLFALSINKGTQTSTTKTLRNDADTATIATSTISSDGTTFTRNKYT